MSKSINQVLLAGNVGKDPEVRTLDGGVKVATFSLATSTGGYKKQDGTEVAEKTQWHSIIAWRGLAEIAEKYVHKGDKIIILWVPCNIEIMGTLQYREYEKDGIKRYATDILAYDLMLSGKGDSSNSKPPLTAEDAPTQAGFPPIGPADDLPF